GMQLVDVQTSRTQGGSIRAFIRHSGEPSARVLATLEHEATMGLRSVETYANWQRRVDYTRDRLREILADFRGAGKTIAGYGASAKSATLLNYCGFGPADIPYIVDNTPYKIDCLTPGSQIPIRAAHTQGAPDPYLLLIWNYLGGVMRREHRFVANGGRFIVPIPHPVVL